MTAKNSLFSEIQDPIARKRALADSASEAIEQIIDMKGVPFGDLLDKLDYLKRVLVEIKSI